MERSHDGSPDEVIYTDYKDEARSAMTSIKFKTTNKRIRYWVVAYEEIFNNEKWYEFGQNLVTLKHKDSSNKNLMIKFYLSTGVVLVQGLRYMQWKLTYYDRLKARVDELCPEEHNEDINKPIRNMADHDKSVRDLKQYADIKGDIVPASRDDSVVVTDSDDCGSVNDINECDGVSDNVRNGISDNERSGISDNEHTAHVQYDPVKRLEEAYMKLVATHNLNTSSLQSEIDEIKHGVRKIPHKVYDSMKKDIQTNTNAIREITVSSNEYDDLKN